MKIAFAVVAVGLLFSLLFAVGLLGVFLVEEHNQHVLRQEERQDFLRSHAWVACLTMSKMAIADQRLKVGYNVWMASTTYGFGFWTNKTAVPRAQAEILAMCEKEYLHDGEVIVRPIRS